LKSSVLACTALLACTAVLAMLPILERVLDVGQCLHLLELVLCQQRVALNVTYLTVLTQYVVFFAKDLSLTHTLEDKAECSRQMSPHVCSRHQRYYRCCALRTIT